MGWENKISSAGAEDILFEPEAHAFSFLGATDLADDSFAAAFTLRNWLRKTHLRFLQRHHTALKNLAVETADEVFVSLVLIFSSNFDCHTVCIIANYPLSCNTFVV